MTVKQMLLFGAVVALEVKTSEQKMIAPDDDEYDFADDDDDDPADFSVGQFLGDDDDDSFLQTKTRNKRNLALKTHVAASKAGLLQKENSKDDDDDDDNYNYGGDNEDDASDYGVGQFLDDDDEAFVQLKTRSGDDDDDYADDRIGAGEYVSLSEATEQKAMAENGEEDEDSGDDTDGEMNEVFLQEARKHYHKHQQKHKHHKKSVIALEHQKALLKHSMLGVTDIYKQLAFDEAHGKVGEDAGWMPADDEDSDEGASFLQTSADLEGEASADDDDDDENGLADDRLDGGMDQILAATEERDE